MTGTVYRRCYRISMNSLLVNFSYVIFLAGSFSMITRIKCILFIYTRDFSGINKNSFHISIQCINNLLCNVCHFRHHMSQI